MLSSDINDEVEALVLCGDIDAVAPHVKPPEAVPEDAPLWRRVVYLFRLWRWRRAERKAEDEVQSAAMLLTCFGARALARKAPPQGSKGVSARPWLGDARPQASGAMAMADADRLAEVLAAVRNEDSDASRVSAMRFALRRAHLSAADAGQVLRAFDSDRHRIEALKVLRDHVRNPEHWYEVTCVFNQDHYRRQARQLCPLADAFEKPRFKLVAKPVSGRRPE